MAALSHVMGGRRPGWPVAIMAGSMFVSWFVYVPIHELMHAWGCQWTGGTVTELQIDARYGGRILANYFDYVKPASDYAGRLTGFDTKGSDFVYLSTVFLPFSLTILLGVPLLRWCARAPRPALLGTAFVVALAPIYQFWGDYYEIGSIVVTRGATWIRRGADGAIAYEAIRADDLFRLLGEVFTKRAEWGLESTGRLFTALFLIACSTAASIVLAFLTYAVGGGFSRILGLEAAKGIPVRSGADVPKPRS